MACTSQLTQCPGLLTISSLLNRLVEGKVEPKIVASLQKLLSQSVPPALFPPLDHKKELAKQLLVAGVQQQPWHPMLVRFVESTGNLPTPIHLYFVLVRTLPMS